MKTFDAPFTFNTPVLLLVFNRPSTTSQVFESIRQVKPPRLYIGADGARQGKNEDHLCTEVRSIATKVDWECEVHTLFREENLGCGRAPSGAIDWFFEHEEAGIILEDDCLPSQGFFYFCDEMLRRYKDNHLIWQIAGTNMQDGWRSHPEYSYYFSQPGAGPTWGWATWRRAWNHYDFNVPLFEEMNRKGYLDAFMWNAGDTQWIMDELQRAYEKDPTITCWDYQWLFTQYIHSGRCIVPQVNMIQNIGINTGQGTHTLDADPRHANRPYFNIEFPLVHPPYILDDLVADRRYFRNYYQRTLTKKITRRTRRIMSKVAGL